MEVRQTALQRWLPDTHLHMLMTHSFQIALTMLGLGLQLKPAAVWSRGEVTAAYCTENQKVTLHHHWPCSVEIPDPSTYPIGPA